MFDNDINFIFAKVNNGALITGFIVEMTEKTEQIKRDLPDAVTVLVLGILSLIFSFSCGIIGLILGIVSVVMASSQRRIYLAAPHDYTENSFKNVNTGRVCGIISICFSAIAFVIVVLIFCGIVVLGISAATLGL